MRQIMVVLVAVATVAVVQGFFYTYVFLAEKKRDELRRRLQINDTNEALRLNLLRRTKLSSRRWLSNLLRGVPKVNQLEELLQQAQANVTVAELGAYSLLLALLIGMIVTVWGGLLLGLLTSLAGLVTPILILLAKRTKRSQKLTEQLPDALDMMARSLRAGHALPSTFRLVADEMPEPVSFEFGIAFEEQNLGASFDRAVLQMAKRAPGNGDLKIFAVSVIIQKETGGNLVEVIEKISETIRARYRFYGKLRALTAEGRISGIVLAVLPLVTVFATGLLNPSYMKLLVTTPMGHGFLIYAILSWMLGVLWLKKIAKVYL